MNSDALCTRILRCESEDAVRDVINSSPELSNTANWRPLDHRETNYNVVTNQAATGGKALTELCTNMVDAIIMMHAERKGIDPQSPSAPRSVTDAVRDLVQLRGAPSGVLAEVDDDEYLREYARKNLIIGVTGDSKRPCFTFVDAGEGQDPTHFKDTFLSLSSGRKSKIPFVQGKYNMGSSGVLSYSGRRWYKLVISRKYDKSSLWGWTLVRRRPGDGTPVAEYFVSRGNICTLAIESVHPFVLSNGRLDEDVTRSTGTIIKLYSYNLGGPANFRTIREVLNENLVSTVLPFRLMDYRSAPRRGGGRKRRALGIDERTVNGLDYQVRRRLTASKQEDDGDIEEADGVLGHFIHVAEIRHPDLGHVRVKAIRLPKELPGWLRPHKNINRIYHAVNGQVQYKQTRGFLARQCKLPTLMDRVIILVDASDLTESAHNDIWKGDRETIRRTDVGTLYDTEVRTAIRESEDLKRLGRKIGREELKQATSGVKAKLFEAVVSQDPHVAQLLPGGSAIRFRETKRTGGEGKEQKYLGKYHPTYLKLIGRRLRTLGVDIVSGETRRIRFETDAVNEWLTRSRNRGTCKMGRKGAAVLASTASLQDGSLSLTVKVVGSVDIGNVIRTNIELYDSGMPQPISESVSFRIVAAREKKKPGNRNRSTSNNEIDQQRGLPPTKWLTSDGRRIEDEETEEWPRGFSAQDGGTVVSLGDEGHNIYKINFDNAHLQYFLRQENRVDTRKMIIEQYRLSMLILMLSFEHTYSGLPEKTKDELEEQRDRLRRLMAQSSAAVVMSITQTLSPLVARHLEEIDD